ncbi:YaeQ family protein [Pigmentiphaga soli]|uniref:YaeQ family protein n=1 Tax=Pigmentiphaga soli TaxID=1007095 RepID=A0ABP8GYQ7_9BURK
MALRSTVYKAALQIADMDRHYYADHSLVLARHPSETDERMMMRLLAFALHADPALVFGRGLSSDDEADLWRRDLTGAIELWVEVGLPDEKWIRKACGRAAQVVLYVYGRAAGGWWEQQRAVLGRLDNLAVYRIAVEESQALAVISSRSMAFSCTIQDGTAWFGADDGSLSVSPEKLYPL